MRRFLILLVSLLSLTAAPAFADHEHRGSSSDELEDLARQTDRQERKMLRNLEEMEELAAQLPRCDARDELFRLIAKSRRLTERMRQTDEQLIQLAEAPRRSRGHHPRGEYGYESAQGRGPRGQVVVHQRGPVPASPSDYARVLQAIEGEWFDDGKLVLAKEVAKGRFFTVSQVLGIVELMTFSDAKVDIAVFLHRRTVDPENFYLVYQSMTFSSDKDKLRRLIAQR